MVRDFPKHTVAEARQWTLIDISSPVACLYIEAYLINSFAPAKWVSPLLSVFYMPLWKVMKLFVRGEVSEQRWSVPPLLRPLSQCFLSFWCTSQFQGSIVILYVQIHSRFYPGMQWMQEATVNSKPALDWATAMYKFQEGQAGVVVMVLAIAGSLQVLRIQHLVVQGPVS